MTNLNMWWTDNGDELSFRYVAEGYKIEGSVTRHFDSWKYGIQSVASAINSNLSEFCQTKKPLGVTFNGKCIEADDGFNFCSESNRFKTIEESICEHFREQYGIKLARNEIFLPEMTTEMKEQFLEAVEKLVADSIEDLQKDSFEDRREIESMIAERIVSDGSCLSDYGHSDTVDFGLLNIDSYEIWNKVKYLLEEEERI